MLNSHYLQFDHEQLGITDPIEKARFLKLMAILDNSQAKIIDLTSSAIVNIFYVIHVLSVLLIISLYFESWTDHITHQL